MIVEPIQGVGGFCVPPDGFFGAMKKVLDEYEILFISDEVQTGWGRTGEHFWGYEAHGVVPDALTFAKGLGNGLAIAGLVARGDLMDSMQANSISTFGGNPLATAGALANLQYLLDNDLQGNALRVGLVPPRTTAAARGPLCDGRRGAGPRPHDRHRARRGRRAHPEPRAARLRASRRARRAACSSARAASTATACAWHRRFRSRSKRPRKAPRSSPTRCAAFRRRGQRPLASASVLVRVPASSANMGPGFDALGLALGMYLEVRLAKGDPAGRRTPFARRLRVGRRRRPDLGPVPDPDGPRSRVLGSRRVAGVLAALAQKNDGADVDALADETLDRAAALEGHEDNVAASLYGGVVAVAGGTAVRVPLGLEPTIVVWVPTARTSTEESRGKLPASVSLADATFNVGRTALLVAALAAGDAAALSSATADRLHQDIRLAAAPESRRAMNAAVEAGAWCSWLSGSGPTIAALVAPDHAKVVAAALPSTGQARVLSLDHRGAVIER